MTSGDLMAPPDNGGQRRLSDRIRYVRGQLDPHVYVVGLLMGKDDLETSWELEFGC